MKEGLHFYVNQYSWTHFQCLAVVTKHMTVDQRSWPLGSSQTQPEEIPWNNHPVCRPPTGKDIGVGCTVDRVAGNGRKLDMLTPRGTDCSRSDMECKLFGGEGRGAGVESRAVPTKYGY